MAYKILGLIVWKGGKWFVGRKYGTAPRNVVAGTVVAGALAATAIVALRDSRSA